MGRTRVLIIDEHERVRSALRTKLRRERDLHVIETAASTSGELEEALRFEPDVVLLEVKRSDGKGIVICRKILRERPRTRVLILTSYPDTGEKRDVQAKGAAGYLLKDLDIQELVLQIRAPRVHANPGEECR